MINIFSLTILAQVLAWNVGFSSLSEAKTFATSFIQFSLPDQWECQQVHADWVCKPIDKQNLHTASIVVSAKQSAPQDTLNSLEEQLKTPRTITGSARTPVTSQIHWVRRTTINNHLWVESLHHNREIEGYLTYYMATVGKGLTILVNFSYQDKLADFYELVTNGIRSTIILYGASGSVNPQGNTKPIAPMGPTLQVIARPTATATPRASTEPIGEANKKMFLFLVLLGVVVTIFYVKRKQR